MERSRLSSCVAYLLPHSLNHQLESVGYFDVFNSVARRGPAGPPGRRYPKIAAPLEVNSAIAGILLDSVKPSSDSIR